MLIMPKKMLSRSTQETDGGLSVETYLHPDDLAFDVVQLFKEGERENVEFSAAWYRDLVDTVYPDDDGVRIYVLRKQGKPVVALPVRVRKAALSQQVESLSNYYTSVYAPLIQADIKPHDMVFLVSYVRDAHAPMGAMRFAPMDPLSGPYRTLLGALQATGLIPFQFFCFGNWYQPVSDDWPTYLACREGTIRSTIKRMKKKFTAKGGTLELVLGGVDLARGLAAYELVYAKSWKTAEPFPRFVPSLIRTCAEKGWLRLGVAWLNDQPIAAQIWIVANGKANIYKLAYDEDYKAYASGTLLTAMLMEHAIENDQVVEVDYLIGDDPYKKSWMSHRRERWGIIAYNPKTMGGIIGLIEELSRRAFKPLVTLAKLILTRIGRQWY